MVMTDEAAVLVIDDEESMREGCRQTLDQEGYRTTVAEDGEAGLRLVEQVKPNIVLVDLKMPGMNGTEVIERIRRIDRHIVTIVITGYGSIDSAVATMKVGACDFLSKPFAPEKLLEVVAGGLARHRLEKRSAALEREKQEALDNFAAVVCHQLRSPAAAAAQYLDVLSTGQAGPLTTRQKSMLERAYRRVEELTKLVADWLRLTRIEAGAIRFEPKPVELPRVVEDAWKALPDEKARGRVSLSLVVSDDVRPVRGDEGLLGEVFTNLFENSVKFTSGPGDVTVRLSAAANSIVVSVSDTGVGIPPEELPHLFDPFYRGARAGLKRRGGTHLGLAIVERIVSVHGGSISASSVAVVSAACRALRDLNGHRLPAMGMRISSSADEDEATGGGSMASVSGGCQTLRGQHLQGPRPNAHETLSVSGLAGPVNSRWEWYSILVCRGLGIPRAQRMATGLPAEDRNGQRTSTVSCPSRAREGIDLPVQPGTTRRAPGHNAGGDTPRHRGPVASRLAVSGDHGRADCPRRAVVSDRELHRNRPDAVCSDRGERPTSRQR